MHGVQPDREDRAQPERRQPATPRADDQAAEPVGPRDGAGRRREGRRAGRGGEGRRSTGVERSPGALELWDPQHAREVQPQHDEHHAADLSKQRQVVDERPCGERRGDPEQGEDEAEPRDVGEGMANREPAR